MAIEDIKQFVYAITKKRAINEILEKLENLEDADINASITIAGHKMPLIHFVSHYDLACVLKKLIEKGANVEAKNETLQSPLHIAQARNLLENIYVLTKANPNLCVIGDCQNISPLHFAAQDNLEMLNTYLNCLKNSDIDMNAVKDNSGCTPLHYSARANQFACSKLLIEHGAKASEVDKYNLTPTHYVPFGKDEHQQFLRLHEVPSLFDFCAFAVKNQRDNQNVDLPEVVEDQQKYALNYHEQLKQQKNKNQSHVENRNAYINGLTKIGI